MVLLSVLGSESWCALSPPCSFPHVAGLFEHYPRGKVSLGFCDDFNPNAFELNVNNIQTELPSTVALVRLLVSPT